MGFFSLFFLEIQLSTFKVNKWVFLQPKKVVFNYIFITSVTFVPQILQLFIDQITIFLPPQLPFLFLFPLLRTTVKISKFLFYIINLIFYSIFPLFSDFNLHFNFLISNCILITLKPFLILPITPSSQNHPIIPSSQNVVHISSPLLCLACQRVF